MYKIKVSKGGRCRPKLHFDIAHACTPTNIISIAMTDAQFLTGTNDTKMAEERVEAVTKRGITSSQVIDIYSEWAATYDQVV